MKRYLALAMALLLLLSITACKTDKSSDNASEAKSEAASEPASKSEVTSEASLEKKVEIVVFAAASMTETLEEIAQIYKEISPNVTLTFNFDSSGTLKTQIQEGADCDIFISAGQMQMDQLDIEAESSVNTENLDYISQGSRIDLLENQVTLCVPKGNPDGIESFENLANKLTNSDILLAMGNSDVPVGQYTKKILDFYNLEEEALANSGKITYGTNVKEVTTQIAESSVSCGVVYCSDAMSAELEIVDYATAEMCGQVIYPAAVINTSQNVDAAEDFLAYLQTAEAMAVFQKVGFTEV